MEHFPEIYRN